MKLKYIAAAIGLMASAASQATLTYPEGTGLGELALVVFDANASYTLDLGITYSGFLANAGSSSTLATLSSANWTTFVNAESANSAAWQYAVIDAKTDYHGVNNAAILSTIQADSVGNVIGNFDSSNVEGAVGVVQTYFDNVNRTGHMPAANGDSYDVKGSPAYYLTSNNDTFNQSFYTNSDLVGTAMAVEKAQRQQSGGQDPIETILPGQMNLTAGSYVLSYTVAAVPEASGYAMALAGLGAVGFIGYRRRDRS